MVNHMKLYIAILGLAAIALSGCKKILEPEPENLKTIEQAYTDATFAQGILINCYNNIPAYYDNSEQATDDAVTNQLGSGFQQLATGAWTSSNNPVSLWNQSYEAMQYINLFLENSAKVKFAADVEVNTLFNRRFRGEAFGLRALYYFYLLRNHGGVASNGQLMGVPIVTKYQTVADDFNQPRASFDDCVKQIYRDLDSAETYLPVEYNDISAAAQIPAAFQSYTQNVNNYNRVMGTAARQFVNGLIAKAVRARVALLAASPAFAPTAAKWQDAATSASVLIDYRGGANALPLTGGTYYATDIDNQSNGSNPPEIIWRANLSSSDLSNQQEAQHFPPSLFGSGIMNPTQNLVDAFPMANGYPINHPNATYNPANPYANRDPRLRTYIIFDGSTAGVTNAVIRTGSSSTTADAINKPNATRTGYYMRKRLRMDVSRNPSSLNPKNHFLPRMRFTEMYLAYAEAANEAYGPMGTGSKSYSAYDVIKAIRKRALSPNAAFADPYLEEVKGDQSKMRDLIRNERRLELSFESFRFWDLRRWKVDLTKLNETARGLDVNGSVVTPLDNVEPRSFQSYMYYGPIPISEVQKYSQLLQNQGWR
jgi:hypothetical protein